GAGRGRAGAGRELPRRAPVPARMRLPVALLAGLLVLTARAAESPAESDPLESQRSLVRSLRAQSGNAEAAFGVYAGLARVSAARAAPLPTQMPALSRRPSPPPAPHAPAPP